MRQILNTTFKHEDFQEVLHSLMIDHEVIASYLLNLFRVNSFNQSLDNENSKLFEKLLNISWLRQKIHETSNKNIDNQLKELNEASKDGIQWKIDNNKIVPSHLNVAKVESVLLGTDLRFVNYTKNIYNHAFKKSIEIYTIQNQNQISNSLLKGTFLEGKIFLKKQMSLSFCIPVGFKSSK